MNDKRIASVAVIGAGASGAAAAAALAAEKCFSSIRVFERRETPGGTWIYDDDPGRLLQPLPGHLPPDLDPPIAVPQHLPTDTAPVSQERFLQTPIYSGLTTNVPAIAMAFSEYSFPYGPFVPHWIPKEHIQSYFSHNETDSMLVLNTTVEKATQTRPAKPTQLPGWTLTLRRHDPIRNLDRWWQESFDALVIANGHYSVPYVPYVPGLEEYLEKFPGKVFHSKSYRSAAAFAGKRVLVIGNSASGHDISTLLTRHVKAPLYQSRRSRSRWDGESPPKGIEWKPVITRFDPQSGAISFADGTQLGREDIDFVIYCTGYKPSFPWWDSAANGGDLWDYSRNRLKGSYLHTFFQRYPTLGIIGIPRTLTFRSFEYQAIALARIFAGRDRYALPSAEEMVRWERERSETCRVEGRKFHDIPWENGETIEYFRALFELAGLPQLDGTGKSPPVLNAETRWAVEHIRKYPEHPDAETGSEHTSEEGWVVLRSDSKDLLHFI